MRLSALPGILSLALLACAEPGTEVGGQLPVLEFPEAGVDDPAAYEGYATRFFRDSRGNAVQVYLDAADGRVVHVWADAANESVAFSARDENGRPAPVTWGGPGAEADEEGGTRRLRHGLAFDAGAVEIGWFLLGTMRLERDFQYFEWHLRPYGDPPLVPPQLTALVESLDRLPGEELGAHLALLGAVDVDEVRSRLAPRSSHREEDGAWTVLIEQPSLDGRNRLTLELRGDADASIATVAEDRVSVRALGGERIELDVTIATDSDALTPLGRDRLFNEAFEAYYADQRRAADSLRQALVAGSEGAGGAAEAADATRWLNAFRRFERQVLGLELLSYEEKLMASMPNYATYFGRDQMMSALMLEPISSVDVQEGVIASVLRKIDPSGNVSHEEALGGQAIREAAGEYAAAIQAWEETRETNPDDAAAHLAEARARLDDLQAVRENYNMVDDDFQLSVLVDRYLSRSDVPAERKRTFLTAPAGSGASGAGAADDAAGSGPSRLEALVRNLAFMSELARPYADQPVATNLVSFFHRAEDGWHAGSWRDSRAGYGNGRFAMDVNVVWVPEGLASLERILAALNELGLSAPEALSRAPGETAALAAYLGDPASLSAAVETWRGARRHFEVRLGPAEIRRRVEAALEALPRQEADYWRPLLDREGATRPLSFLALSLDDDGDPVAAPNTDPATELFLRDYTEGILEGTADPAVVLDMADTFERPYPVGLFVEGLGPLVVNDVYASEAVRARFREDLYHSPRVVWGREVNLILLGLARQIEAAYDDDGALRDSSAAFTGYVSSLRRVLEKTQGAVEASGLGHNELWSYRIEDGALRPVRYGVSSDIQLWNVTDLAVTFLLDRLPDPERGGAR